MRPFIERKCGMRISDEGQVTIPPAMRRKHGLVPRAKVEFIDRPDGVLVARASKPSRGKQVLPALLRGGWIKGRTEDWLRLTRGEA